MTQTAVTHASTNPGCPADVSRTLHSFIIELSQAASDADRQQLASYRNQIVGTAGQPDSDQQAGYMCVDWLVRVYTPAFLRDVGLDRHADELADADEIIDLATLRQVKGPLMAAADSAARCSVGSAVYWAEVDSTDLGRSAAGAAALSAARSEAHAAALSAARWAAELAARSAAASVAADPTTAAQERFTAVVAAVDASAVELLGRMIAVYPSADA